MKYVRVDRVRQVLHRRADRSEKAEIDDIVDEIAETTVDEDELLRSVSRHRDELEAELESAVNELRLLADQLQDTVENREEDDG